MSNVEDTLKERGTRYGDFVNHADISQELKDIVKANDGDLAPLHKEALDMILHKVARILNGDPNFIDSWHDIAGYAILVEKQIEKNNATEKLLA